MQQTGAIYGSRVDLSDRQYMRITIDYPTMDISIRDFFCVARGSVARAGG